MAEPTLKAFRSEADVIVIISDGYENVSTGNLDSVIESVNNTGIMTPVIFLNPVMGSEAGDGGGIRKLSKKTVSFPVKGPESLAHIYLKMAINLCSNRFDFIPSLKNIS